MMLFPMRCPRLLSRFGIYICLVAVVLLITVALIKLRAEKKLSYHFIPWNNVHLKSETHQLPFPTVVHNLAHWSELCQQHNLQQIQSVASLISLDAKRFIMLTVFQNLLNFLGIKSAVIEPTVLFSTLDSRRQNLLTKRKYNASNFKGSKDVLTYGMFEDDIQRLQSDFSIDRLREVGFQPYFVQKPLAEWMAAQPNGFKNNTYTSHAFLMYFDLTVHIVVFYNRHNYLWHAGFDSELDLLQKKNWLFANYPGAFEKFLHVPLGLKVPLLSTFDIPSNTDLFLFQMDSSRFLECSATRSVNSSYTTDLPKKHGSMSIEEFNNKTVSAIRHLKNLLHPLLMNFFIFCGTMLGWYRDCDIIPYTHDVDFAGWADEIDNIDIIIGNGIKNKDFTLTDRWGLPEEALELRFSSHSVRVDLFFHYKVQNGSWTPGHLHSQGYYFRYYFPHFTLCSADLMGEKVLVPCETELIISTDYGPDWRTPVSEWNYISSSKNRGPNIYWDKKRLNLTYQEY